MAHTGIEFKTLVIISTMLWATELLSHEQSLTMFLEQIKMLQFITLKKQVGKNLSITDFKG